MTDREIIDRQQEVIEALAALARDVINELAQYRAVEVEEKRLEEATK